MLEGLYKGNKSGFFNDDGESLEDGYDDDDDGEDADGGKHSGDWGGDDGCGDDGDNVTIIFFALLFMASCTVLVVFVGFECKCGKLDL